MGAIVGLGAFIIFGILAFLGLILFLAGSIWLIAYLCTRKSKNRKVKKVVVVPILLITIGSVCLTPGCLIVGAAINDRQYKKEYPQTIQYAVENDDINKVKELLESGVHPDKCYGKSTFTALLTACIHEHEDSYEIAKLLLEYGANPNTEEDGALYANYEELSITKGFTPLLYASGPMVEPDQKLELVKLLVEYGANVNRVSETGKSALSLSREFGNRNIEEYLIKQGAMH